MDFSAWTWQAPRPPKEATLDRAVSVDEVVTHTLKDSIVCAGGKKEKNDLSYSGGQSGIWTQPYAQPA